MERQPVKLNNRGTSGSLVVSKRKPGMRRTFPVLLAVALIAVAVFAQTSFGQQNPSKQSLARQQILPDQFAGWQPGQGVHGGGPQVLLWPRDPKVDNFDGHPEYTALLVESGVIRAEEHHYQKGGAEIAVRAFRLQDPSSAYEVYTSLLKPGEMPAKLGQVAAFDKDGVLIQEGSLVIGSTANISREDLLALLEAVEAKAEKTTPLPPIRTYLPMEGRLVGSERYALGPEALKAALTEAGQAVDASFLKGIGFNNGGEAMLARYSQPGKGSGVLLLLEYPTPNVAEQQIHHLAEVLPASAKVGEQNVVRKGSLLSIVLSPSSAEYAASLREGANYETQVTWNEPHQTLTDPPLLSTIAKIFVATGVFMVVTVVLGIAFGGVRIITKRLFPGKVFDRPEQIEVLQLGLSGKRIDPTDLY
jgi:hypothetical protein